MLFGDSGKRIVCGGGRSDAVELFLLGWVDLSLKSSCRQDEPRASGRPSSD
jgi:hypothetical protein